MHSQCIWSHRGTCAAKWPLVAVSGTEVVWGLLEYWRADAARDFRLVRRELTSSSWSFRRRKQAKTEEG